MTSSPDLSEREQRFVDIYCGPGNLTPYEAAKKAGYRGDAVIINLPSVPEEIRFKPLTRTGRLWRSEHRPRRPVRRP